MWVMVDARIPQVKFMTMLEVTLKELMLLHATSGVNNSKYYLMMVYLVYLSLRGCYILYPHWFFFHIDKLCSSRTNCSTSHDLVGFELNLLGGCYCDFSDGGIVHPAPLYYPYQDNVNDIENGKGSIVSAGDSSDWPCYRYDVSTNNQYRYFIEYHFFATHDSILFVLNLWWLVRCQLQLPQHTVPLPTHPRLTHQLQLQRQQPTCQLRWGPRPILQLLQLSPTLHLL